MNEGAFYNARRVPRHERVRLRGLAIHLSRWGPPPSADEPPLFLLHGWQDTGDTFQFMVDAFANDWPLVALDWRGFGRSEWPQEGYWFADYLADLDALLDLLSPAQPACLIGHSMGGNAACLYAGVKPDRVRSLVSLEGFGLPRQATDAVPAVLATWLQRLKKIPDLKTYASFDQLASVIQFRYPRFSGVQCAFIARAWGRADPDGRVHLLGDARHRWPSPLLYRREDAEACWRRIRAPTLMLLGEQSELLASLGADGTDAALRAAIPHAAIVRVAAAGHMLHIERAAAVAAEVERFLIGSRS